MNLSVPINYYEETLRNTCRNIHIEAFFSDYLSKFTKHIDLESGQYYKLSKSQKLEYTDYFKSKGFKGVSTKWVEFYYGVTGHFDTRYIPDDIFNMYIDPVFPDVRRSINNKVFQPKFLPDVKFPRNIVSCINGQLIDDSFRLITIDKALALIKSYEKVIVKPSIYSGGGTAVKVVNSSDINKKWLKDYGEIAGIDNNYVIQEIIEQSAQMSQFNESSVNTDKIFSFIHNGEVHILSSHIRMGVAGSFVDNASDTEENWYVGIDEQGRLDEYANNSSAERSKNTKSGIPFSSIKIDFHRECIDIVKQSHPHLAQFPFISWDFAQASDGSIILIEYNMKYHSLIHFQLHSGPIFGDFTDEVLQLAAKYRDRNHGLFYRFR